MKMGGQTSVEQKRYMNNPSTIPGENSNLVNTCPIENTCDINKIGHYKGSVLFLESFLEWTNWDHYGKWTFELIDCLNYWLKRL